MASPAPDEEARLRRALVILLLGTTAARLALAGLLDLGQDEAYALAVSGQFQWSFFDHPPLAFWLAGLMQALFGRDLPPLLLRLPFVLMFTGSSWAMFALTRHFYGARAGLWAAGLVNTAPFFFASAGGWVVPDGPLTLFLLLAALCLVRALHGAAGDAGRWRDWLFAGLCLGLALLSKYQAVLALAGALLVLLGKPNRAWLLRPQPYAAVLLALVVFLPAIGWNAGNQWISFAFQLGRGGGHAAFDAGRPLGLLAGEAVYLLPWMLVALLVAAVMQARTPAGRFFLALALPAILLFNLVPLVGSTGLPHWSMSGWLFLFPPLGAQLAAAAERRRRWPTVFGWASGLAMGAIAVIAVVLLSDHRLVFGNAALDHAMVEATSWSGVRQGLAARGLLDRPHTFYAAMTWLDGAHLAEAVRPASPPVVFGDDPRGFAFVGSPARHLGEDAIFAVAPESLPGALGFIAGHFSSVDTLGTFTTAKGGVPAYTQVVLLAHDFSTAVVPPYGLMH